MKKILEDELATLMGAVLIIYIIFSQFRGCINDEKKLDIEKIKAETELLKAQNSINSTNKNDK